jgi:hypothetical protein
MPVRANGPLKKLLAVLGLAVLSVVGMTFWIPFSAGYEVKIAAKTVCNKIVFDLRNNSPANRVWEKEFVQKARLAGVRLTPEQYDFTGILGMRNGEHRCKAHIRWRSVTPWFFISDYSDIPPLVQIHDLDFEHNVKANY